MELTVLNQDGAAAGGGCSSSGCGSSGDQLSHLPEHIRAKLHNHPCYSEEACDILITAAEVERAFEEIAPRYGDRGELAEDLQHNGLDEELLQASLCRELLFDAVMQRVGARAIEFGELDFLLYYERNRDRFSFPREAQVPELSEGLAGPAAPGRRYPSALLIRRPPAEPRTSPGRRADNTGHCIRCGVGTFPCGGCRYPAGSPEPDTVLQ